MFNTSGTAYAAGAASKASSEAHRVALRAVVQRQRHSRELLDSARIGSDYEITPCLKPLAPFRKDIHIISGLDNPNGKGHHGAMSSLMSGEAFTGRGAGGPSIDQVIAQKIGNDSRFRSLQIGVCQESFGESIQRNMSWAGRDRPLPPEMIPHRLFDRLFGGKDLGWIDRKKSVLDRVREDAAAFNSGLGQEDKTRVDEYLTSVRTRRARDRQPAAGVRREVERPEDTRRHARLAADRQAAIGSAGPRAGVGPDARRVLHADEVPEPDAISVARAHDAAPPRLHAHRANVVEGQRIMRDICRWHVEEFAYLLGKLKSIPEGDGNLLDHTLIVYVHEHAEANSHKTSGMAAILAGHAGGVKTGMHSMMTGTVGDLYLTLREEVMGAQIGKFPSATKKLSDIV